MRGQSLYDYCMEHEDKGYLLDEWDYEKNESELGISPKDVSRGSNKKVYWICKGCNNSFYQSMYKRTGRGHGCHYCGIEKRALSHSKNASLNGNDLVSNYPELLLDWDYGRNDILPSEISKGSAKKVMWKCHICKYEWEAKICVRTRGLGCPQCAKEKQSSFPEQAIYYYLKQVYKEVINGEKDLLGNNSELDIYIHEIKTAIEYDGVAWHKDTNKDLKKNKLCQEKGIRLIRIREEGLIDIEGSLNIFRKDRHSDSDLEVVLRMLFSLLNIQVDVNIERDKQEIYSQYVQSKKENSLAFKFPEIAKEWHPTKNGSLTPENVSYGSGKKVWWICDKGHEYIMSIVNRTSKGRSCSICSGHLVLKGFNDLATTNPELLNEWYYEKNGDLSPDAVTMGCNKKVYWCCSECNYVWTAVIASRTNGSGCPECGKKKAVTNRNSENNDLASNYPNLLKDWDNDKNEVLPSEISKGSHKEIHWKCSVCGHEYVRVAREQVKIKGTHCPECAKKNRKS